MILHSFGTLFFMRVPVPVSPFAIRVSRRLIVVKYLSKNRWVPWGTLHQMKNSLLSNALPFCNSEGSLALVDHKGPISILPLTPYLPPYP
ncbi:unnamed protein product [Arctogadus glacialis]